MLGTYPMNAKKNHERLDFLTSKMLDEVATSLEVTELEALIQSDVGLRKRYSSLIFSNMPATCFTNSSKIHPKLIPK